MRKKITIVLIGVIVFGLLILSGFFLATTSKASTINNLDDKWTKVQASFPIRPSYRNYYEYVKKIWRDPDAVQFIGKKYLLVRFEDDYNVHVAILKYGRNHFDFVELFKDKAQFSQSDWQGLIEKYGGNANSVVTYSKFVIRNNQILTFSALEEVPENVFIYE